MCLIGYHIVNSFDIHSSVAKKEGITYAIWMFVAYVYACLSSGWQNKAIIDMGVIVKQASSLPEALLLLVLLLQNEWGGGIATHQSRLIEFQWW